MRRPVADLPSSPTRRRLLRSTLGIGGLAGLPWLGGCGSGGTALDGGPIGMPATGPRGLHLSFGADPSRERFVTWFTDGLDPKGSVLEFGSVDEGLPLDAPFPERVLGEASPTFGVDAMTHRARLVGFDPDKPLRYRVSDGERFSPVQVAQPIPREGYRICHFADNGLTAAAAWVQDAVMRRQPHFFLLPGDLSYADGDQPLWDQWFQRMEPLAATAPMVCCGGNHEENDGNGEGWLSRVSHPYPNGPLGRPARGWYAYDVHRIGYVVSTGGSFIADGRLAEELLFVETALARAALRRAAGEIDFIAFVMHYTIWTDQEGRGPNNPALVLLVENILVRYGVDLVLVGHDHVYQRSLPMAFGRPNPRGYIQVTAGHGGKSMRGFDPISNWSAVDATRYGFSEYEVSGDRITARSYAVDREDNSFAGGELTLLDEFSLSRRSVDLAAQAVQPPRTPDILLADLRAIEADTRRRNRVSLAANRAMA